MVLFIGLPLGGSFRLGLGCLGVFGFGGEFGGLSVDLQSIAVFSHILQGIVGVAAVGDTGGASVAVGVYGCVLHMGPPVVGADWGSL